MTEITLAKLSDINTTQEPPELSIQELDEATNTLLTCVLLQSIKKIRAEIESFDVTESSMEKDLEALHQKHEDYKNQIAELRLRLSELKSNGSKVENENA